MEIRFQRVHRASSRGRRTIGVPGQLVVDGDTTTDTSSAKNAIYGFDSQ
jgi:hypothetical protein